MKNIYLLIILPLLFVSCKTRHVAITKTETITSAIRTHFIKKDSINIDTSNIQSETKSTKNSQDSSEVEITTDSGSIQKIFITKNTPFSYIGKAKHIIFKSKVNNYLTEDNALQIHKGLSEKGRLLDSSIFDKQSNQMNKIKNIETKANHTLLFTLIIILTILSILLYSLHKYFL